MTTTDGETFFAIWAVVSGTWADAIAVVATKIWVILESTSQPFRPHLRKERYGIEAEPHLSTIGWMPMRL
jgi:hypothetical protein